VGVVEIRRLRPADIDVVVSASPMFDNEARREWAALFLTREGHHMLIASVDGTDVGFVSGVEMTHPDKGTEMFLYELFVDEAHRRRGVARALVDALRRLAVDHGCYGMWVGTEPDNVAAIATYRSAGAAPVEPFVSLTWTFPAPPG
jgi:ribosomal protein S18 acetylase RimI-like enzyme